MPVVGLIERVAGSGCWMFVEHPVGWFLGCRFGDWISPNVFGWGVLGSVVMAFGCFIGGFLFVSLVAVVSAGMAGVIMMCIFFWWLEHGRVWPQVVKAKTGCDFAATLSGWLLVVA